jgi:hypothetical protein
MKNAILFILLLITFTSCSPGYKILKPEKENNFHLADYPTYGFYEMEAKGDTVSSTFANNISVIKDAIARTLDEKGLNQAQDPALKINIAISVKEEVQTRQTNFQNDGRPLYMGQRRYSWKSKEVEIGRYKTGTILIDLVDPSTNKMVWRSGGEGVLPGKEKDFNKAVNELIHEIFSAIGNS